MHAEALPANPLIPSSTYTFRRAEDADLPALLRLLEKHVTNVGAAARFDWLYLKNPQGRAQAWLAIGPRGEIAGFTGIFAREWSVDGRRVLGGVGFDAFVLPAHRRRGIALGLHRASRDAMIRGEVPFRFMCGPPVPDNLAALFKAGARFVGELRYLALPLTARGVLQMLHVRGEGVGAMIERTRVIDGLLAGARYVSAGARGLAVRPVVEVGPAFDRLWDRLASELPVVGRRDAAFLRWRYLDNPVTRQPLVAIEDGGELVGWAALELAPKGCLVVDHLLPLDPTLGRRALAALVAHIAERGASRVTLRFNLKGAYTKLFVRQGFLPGWSKEIVQCLAAPAELVPRLTDASGWHMTSGDLNPEASPWSVNTTPAG